MLRGPSLQRGTRVRRLLKVIAGLPGKWARGWARKAALHRQLAAESKAFARLDASALRDLGMSRSEFHSYWVERHGLAERTRRRVDP